MRQTNGTHPSHTRENRRGRPAWCKRFCAQLRSYHCRARGRTSAGYGPLQPARAALTLYREAQSGWNRGAACFIPFVSEGWSIFYCIFVQLQKERTIMKIIYKDGTVAECPQDQELHVLSPHLPTRFHVSGRTLELAQLSSLSLTCLSHSLDGLPMPFS